MNKVFAMVLMTSGLLFSASGWTALQDLDGNPKKLADFTGQGKWTVVMFWASDCHVCNAEAEQYIQYHEANKEKRASVVGITLDGKSKKAEAEAFIKRHAITFPNLIGEPVDVAGLYESLTGGSWVGTPTFLIYNPAGELKAAQPGAVPTELIDDFIKEQTAKKPK